MKKPISKDAMLRIVARHRDRNAVEARQLLVQHFLNALAAVPPGWTPGDSEDWELDADEDKMTQKYARAVLSTLCWYAENAKGLNPGLMHSIVRLATTPNSSETLASLNSLTPIEAAGAATWGDGGVA